MGKAGAHAAVEALISPLTYLPNYLNPQMTQEAQATDISLFWETAGTSAGSAGR